jgi:citrate lyase subunit beta/citryl-CoA lyase
MQYRPRRSALYVPGANARAMEKARGLDADVVILDLEDAVAPDAKTDARCAVAAVLEQGGFGGREVVVRINAPDTPWGHEDAAALAGRGVDGMLVPKIAAPADIDTAGALLPKGAALWVMIETPAAILSVDAIAARARGGPLAVLVMGTNDLAKETRARLTPDRAAFGASLQLCVLAARSHGLDILDGVFNDIEDAEGFAAQCDQGVLLGFDGKTLIHPGQVGPCNAAFAPPAAEIAHARAVVAAFADPANAGRGVLRVDGRMTELLHLEMARRTLAMAQAIEARAQSA